MNKISKTPQLAVHHFGVYGEFIVSFELLKNGWDTYKPIYDKGIDLIIHKEENKKFKFRTIQVRSSRMVNGQKNYGFTIKPTDLYDNEYHFIIILCAGKRNKFDYLIISAKDYTTLMGNSINTKSFKEGNYRHHINRKTFKEGKKDFSQFLNKFEKLE